MGVNKETRRKRRRRFGQACGRQNRKCRVGVLKNENKQEQRNKVLNVDRSHIKPYEIVKKSSYVCGKLVRTITVRRLHLSLNRNTKLLRLGENSLKFKVQTDTNAISGYRIVNLELLKKHICEITSHCCLCQPACELVEQGKDPIVLKSEICRNGLFSVIKIGCNGCGREILLKTSEKQQNGLYDINIRAVWGTVASGNGASDLNEILTTMDIPPMNAEKFTKLEQQVGDWWHECLKVEMMKAAAEEKKIAEEKGSYSEDIPAITVICDGGWSKRTHKHTYNAAGGVAVIFGAETKKLLYIGVRNKYCVVCRKADNANEKVKEHICYKNWDESSQSMETDIILEGFLKCETEYGLRYTKVIADGDSSVFATLQDKVPVWGKDIEKLECANHVCKCLRTNLEKLVNEKPQYKGKGKLTKMNRIKLTTAIRCAIKMRSKTKDVKQLKRDIINSIYHVLGFHGRCSDFCKKNKKGSYIANVDENEDHEDESFDTIFEEQHEFWKLPSDTDMENARLSSKNQLPITELKELIRDVQVILNRLADKSSRLIGNFTTNLAESWMAIRAKFDGGKVINRCSRGSWATRCYGGALRKNLGTGWSPLAFQTITSTRAGVHFHYDAKVQSRALLHSKKYKNNPDNKRKRFKRKVIEASKNDTKKAKRSYGSNLDDSQDIESTKLTELCDKFIQNNFNKNEQDLNTIEKNTIDQSMSEQWRNERKIRLTSSNFGKVVKRRPNNKSSNLVKNMLYPTFKGNIFTIRGLSEEKNTITEYKKNKKDIYKLDVTVEKAGFKVCKDQQFLGASTDGIVQEGNEKGLLEIKNFLQNNNYMFSEAVDKVPNFCLEKKGSKMSLKKTHDIYYQIQGQMNIFELNWCDFVVRRTKPYEMHIERIYRDKVLWSNVMLPKLECFYHKFVLPELAHPRHDTYSGIREPALPWFDESKYPNTPKRIQKRGKGTVTEPKPSTSHCPAPSTSQEHDTDTTVTRSRRERTVKFVGRHILHEWETDEATGETKWYTGIVTDVLKGKDGDSNAVYEVQYEGEDTPYEVDDLLSDYRKGTAKFKDL